MLADKSVKVTLPPRMKRRDFGVNFHGFFCRPRKLHLNALAGESQRLRVKARHAETEESVRQPPAKGTVAAVLCTLHLGA